MGLSNPLVTVKLQGVRDINGGLGVTVMIHQPQQRGEAREGLYLMQAHASSECTYRQLCHFAMEPGVLGQSNRCGSDSAVKQQTRSISFSKELISFSLYGKIPRTCSE